MHAKGSIGFQGKRTLQSGKRGEKLPVIFLVFAFLPCKNDIAETPPLLLWKHPENRNTF